MVFFWSDDPVADAERYYEEQEEEIERLPVCSCCCEHINDEYAYFINDEWICEDCMDGFRKEVEPDE